MGERLPYRYWIQNVNGMYTQAGGTKPLVHGDGQPGANCLIVGYQAEEGEAKPFMGKTNGLLREALATVGVPFHYVFLSYVIKEYGEPTLSFQWPSLFWREMYDWLKPKAVILLGNLPFHSLFQNQKWGEINTMRDIRFVYEPLPELNFFVTYAPKDITAEQGGIYSATGLDWLDDLRAVFEVSPLRFRRVHVIKE